MLRLTETKRAAAGKRDIGVPGVLLLLAPGQLVSWGTLYYAIAFLAAPIARDTGWELQEIFLAFSAGLLVAAFAAAPAGRLLSRHGGRPVMLVGSLAAAFALMVIALSLDLATFTAGWLLAGLAMALTQYEAAFSSLRALVPGDFRRALGWLTVAGGFASTMFWPLTDWLADALGWRRTVLLFAGLHIVPCLLLHAALPKTDRGRMPRESGAGGALHLDFKGCPVPVLLGFAFAATAVVTATVSAQAGGMLEAMRIQDGFALAMLALIGPMQAAGRLLDMAWAKALTAAGTGLIALAAMIAGLLLFDRAEHHAWALLGFSIAYGMANGMLTVVRGSAPAELMPDGDYAADLGIISGPALFARAVAPAAAAWLIESWGARALPLALASVAAIGLATFLAAVLAARNRNPGTHEAD